MATNRSRFISPSYKIHAKYKAHLTNDNELAEDNINFAQDDGNALDIDFDDVEIDEAADIDEFQVKFSTVDSSIDINHQTATNEPLPTTNETAHAAIDEEVAANVSNVDDPTVLVLTFRSWFLGLLFTCLLSFVNQFFWYRTSPLFVGTLVAQLLSYPLGKTMARLLPTRHFRIFRWNFTLNPGPFTIKEHCIITAMANATCVIVFLSQKFYTAFLMDSRVRHMPSMS